MEKSKTRKKLFRMCMIFMCIFMVLFVWALQGVTNSAFSEAYSDAEIKEMQQLYNMYRDLRSYYEESISLFSGTDYIKQQIVETMAEAQYADKEKAYIKADEFAEQFIEYFKRVDVYIVDKNSIISLSVEYGLPHTEIFTHTEGDSLNFINNDAVYNFLNKYNAYEQKDTYKSEHVVIKNLKDREDIFIIGIPKYDEIFDFKHNGVVIYNKDGEEQLRLNTEGIDRTISASDISKGKSYKLFGFGKNKRLLCYYSNEDERGDYCLSISNNLSLTFRHYIYLCLIIFFALVSIIFWFWSEKITKPLDFFLMWIKLIKDKGTLQEDENAEMPMPKENYFLQNNIMIFFSFCLVPIIFAGALQWYTENQILNKYIEERYVESAEFCGYILDEQYYSWQNPVVLMCTDERVVNSLQQHKADASNEYDIQFINYIHEYSQVLAKEVDVVTVYNSEGKALVSSSSNLENDNYIKYRVNVGEDYKWTFTESLEKFILHQKIYNEKGDIIGYCKVELNEPYLYANVKHKKEYLYSCYIYKYTDKIYNLLSTPKLSDDKVINMIRSNESESLSKSMLMEKANINYFYVVNEKIFFDKVWNHYVVSFMNVVFFLIIAFIFSASILTRSTLNPIIHISNALYNDSPNIPMSTLLLGQEEFALIVNRVKALSEQVNEYAKEQKILEAERHEHEKRRKDAEILTLQTQINPHFMYNIFSSIAVLIKTGQTDTATKMVMYTGNLMRMGLYRGHVMIPLKEEMDHVNQYIKIQQIRYNDCIDVNINIDDVLMNIKVVKFILQPIVENAIEHNVGYLEDENLVININGEIREDKLIIQIIDNGIGMKDEHMQKLQDSIDNFDMSNHLGLANINERIKLNCGEEYGVILGDDANGGLRVELILPIVIEKEEQ